VTPVHVPARLVLLGHPVAHSLSPRFQNAALQAAHIPVRYEAIDVPGHDLDRVIESLRAEDTWGNVTVPHKERMHDACDEVTPVARRAGAVNTFWIDRRGRLVGDNTDVEGFSTAVATLLGRQPRDLTVGVLGAGGSAAAVLTAVESWPGCYAHVYNRTPERARLLCERFRTVSQPIDDVGVAAGADLVVNTTPVGLHDDDVPMDPSLVAPTSAAIDLVYRRGETPWVRALRGAHVRACDGMSMLIEQGALAFERWFGASPDRTVMWEAIRSA
jgi:shikimate dehydrogenase